MKKSCKPIEKLRRTTHMYRTHEQNKREMNSKIVTVSGGILQQQKKWKKK